MKGILGAQIVKLIRTETAIGDGTEENPERIVVQYWDKKGKLIFKEDPFIKKAEFQTPGKADYRQSINIKRREAGLDPVDGGDVPIVKMEADKEMRYRNGGEADAKGSTDHKTEKGEQDPGSDRVD